MGSSRRRYGDTADADMLMRTDLRTYLSENCLVKTDRASMLASLEVRVPFLDELLLDRIVPLHASHKIVNGQLKALLLPTGQTSAAGRGLEPAEAWLQRPRRGEARRRSGSRWSKMRSTGVSATCRCSTIGICAGCSAST